MLKMNKKIFSPTLNYSSYFFYLIILLSLRAANMKTLVKMNKVGIIHPLESLDNPGNFEKYKNIQEVENKPDITTIESPTKYKVENIINTITLDVSQISCDVKVNEKVKFYFPQPQMSLDYLIISKKIPYYGFEVKMIPQSDAFISSRVVSQDSSFRQRIFQDSLGRRLIFRDRWVITTHFNRPLEEVELEYTYYMERAVLIDTVNEQNYLKFVIINPNDEITNYTMLIELKNFKKLNAEMIKAPTDSLIFVSNRDSSVKIESKVPFRKHSENEVNINLPLELIACERELVNFVYFGLIGMAILFVLLTLITLAYVYKE
jgi:hypothetical protein